MKSCFAKNKQIKFYGVFAEICLIKTPLRYHNRALRIYEEYTSSVAEVFSGFIQCNK